MSGRTSRRQAGIGSKNDKVNLNLILLEDTQQFYGGDDSDGGGGAGAAGGVCVRLVLPYIKI